LAPIAQPFRKVLRTHPARFIKRFAPIAAASKNVLHPSRNLPENVLHPSRNLPENVSHPSRNLRKRPRTHRTASESWQEVFGGKFGQSFMKVLSKFF
jgi:hypothetical protein